jgi:hypothetical protein
VPHGLGLDERAHPCLPALMNALTEDLLPIQVRVKQVERPSGEILYSLNKTKNGWLVSLYNQHGIDKTQNGIARVDRRQFVDVTLRLTKGFDSHVIGGTWPENQQVLTRVVVNGAAETSYTLRVPAGDMLVVSLVKK